MEVAAAVAIPLYNHAATVRDVAERALRVHQPVLVVDDGSTDGGAERLAGLPVALLRHRENLGKGAAILTAATAAREQGMTHLITLDADGQHAPEEIPRVLAAVRQTPEAVVVGCREFATENVPGSSRFGRSFSNFWLRLQTGVALGDAQSGFRAYPLFVLEHLPLKETRFSFEVEVLVRAAWAGVPLHDVPISVYYPPARERISHFHKGWDNLRLTLLNTHLTLRSVVPWPHPKLLAAAAGAPRVSVLRPVQSVRALLTENTTPGRLAAAAAMGVFLGTLPLVAFHTIAILFAAAFFRLNKVAAVTASQLCMPPLVPALCIEVGYFLRHGRWLTEISLETLGYQALERLWEWLLGSLVVAPLLAALVGGATLALALAVQKQARGR